MNLISIIEEAEKSFDEKFHNVSYRHDKELTNGSIVYVERNEEIKSHHRQTLLKLLEGLEKWKELNKTDGNNTTFSDRHLTYHDGFNACLNKLGFLLQPLKDKLKQ